eukprot:CAMPEP_0196818486 /NCGR_PEP_ID=MMETSP1362-20130617/65802_1 /TAXON_ID=163516 /ORGANISM="Leptocylindrus danicus, Strain CCMP1856" /LENGTH=136 /DNA_ID=CAMNT_0042196599 /DNA_START=1 /DNA_END=411 /DNA_ORIENTATION=+
MDATTTTTNNNNADQQMDAILAAILSEQQSSSQQSQSQSSPIIIGALSSMQQENKELEAAKELKSKGVTSILMMDAIVGDNEDVAYATFVVNGVMKKKSSTFNMTGLTGSTNGHFGGVASTISTMWERQKKAATAR